MDKWTWNEYIQSVQKTDYKIVLLLQKYIDVIKTIWYTCIISDKKLSIERRRSFKFGIMNYI